MRTLLLAIVSLTFGTFASAQTRIDDEQLLRDWIKTIASDEFGGRKPMTPYENKTVQYLARENILMKWRDAVYNPRTGKIGWAKNYKREASIVLYSPNGTILRKWVARGVWPTNVELGDMDYSGSDLRKITMTLSVDEAYPDREDTELGASDYSTEGTWSMDAQV